MSDPGIKEAVEGVRDLIEIPVPGRASWAEFGEAMAGVAVAALLVGALGVWGGFVARDLFRVSGALVGLFALTLFGLALVAGAIAALRREFDGYVFRVTPERLAVSVRLGKWGASREFAWRRDAIFEVRPGEDGALHVRLTRRRPCKFLAGRTEQEIEEVARRINVAMSAIPMAVFGDHVPPGELTYEVPGDRYEIDIRPTSEGVCVVVPGAGDGVFEIGLGKYVLAAAVFVTAVVGFLLLVRFAGRFPRGSLAPLFLLLIVPAFVGVCAAEVLLHWWRGGESLVINVRGRRVYIDHPGLIRRRRTWRREAVTEVSVCSREDKNGKAIGHFVRMSARWRGSVTFCHGREVIEIQRVVAALRGSMRLEPVSGATGLDARGKVGG